MTNELGRIDLEPAARQVAIVAAGVGQGQLDDPTPCDGYTVADLLDHLVGLTLVFRRAAEKSAGLHAAAPADPASGAAALPADWRDRLPRQLDDLVTAWRQPGAWRGETTAGGVTMPASQMGVVVLDELVLHGWDLARATGQPWQCTDDHAQAVLEFTRAVHDAGPDARAGLFGPPVGVPDDAPALDRALGFAGRDPAWTP